MLWNSQEFVALFLILAIWDLMPVYVEGNNQKVKNDYNQNSYTIKGINKRNNNIWEKEKKTFVNINKLYISPHRAVTSYIIPEKN